MNNLLSTMNLSNMPDVHRLKSFCKGLAALDIIMIEEEYSFIRHYTYNLIITIQHAKVNESAHKILTNFSRYLTT